MNAFLSKCTVLKVDLLQDHQIYCLQVCLCTLFSPEIVQAGAVKGLKSPPLKKESRAINVPVLKPRVWASSKASYAFSAADKGSAFLISTSRFAQLFFLSLFSA